MLVVAKINNNFEADVIYAWGVAYQWGIWKAGLQKYKAKIRGKVLTIIDDEQKVKITYTLNPYKTINAIYERPGATSQTILTKLEK